MKTISTTSVIALACSSGLAIAQPNLLEDPGFEDGSLGIPGIGFPPSDPPRWDDFGNADFVGFDPDAEFPTPPPFDGDIQLKAFTQLFSGWQFSFLFEELPPFFPFDMAPGEPVDPNDPTGNRMVEVTDGLGTRMVEYFGLPAGGASLARTLVTTADIDAASLADITTPDSNGDISVQTPPPSEAINVGDLIEFSFWHRIESGDLVLPNAAVVQGSLLFRNEGFPEEALDELVVFVDLTNDPVDTWVQYTKTAIVPPDTEWLEVQVLYFGVGTDFTPRDADGDGLQDRAPKDTNFDGDAMDPGEAEQPIYVGPEGPAIDTDGDFLPDTFDTFTDLDGDVGAGASFFDQISIRNLGATCSPVDRATPTGTLDVNDAFTLVDCPDADAAAPEGVFTFEDIIAELRIFDEGC